MKKQIMNSMKNATGNFFIFSLIATLCFNSISNKLHAQQQLKPGDDIYVNYEGTSAGQPVFLVRFSNKGAQFAQLRISNKEGLILYKEKLTGKNFVKRFQIDIPSEEPVELVLSLTDKEGKLSQKYNVNSNMLMVRNVEVTKL